MKMIDTKRAGQLVDLMDMKKGEASVAVVENWWNSKYLLDKIRSSEIFKTRGIHKPCCSHYLKN